MTELCCCMMNMGRDGTNLPLNLLMPRYLFALISHLIDAFVTLSKFMCFLCISFMFTCYSMARRATWSKGWRSPLIPPRLPLVKQTTSYLCTRLEMIGNKWDSLSYFLIDEMMWKLQWWRSIPKICLFFQGWQENNLQQICSAKCCNLHDMASRTADHLWHCWREGK